MFVSFCHISLYEADFTPILMCILLYEAEVVPFFLFVVLNEAIRCCARFIRCIGGHRLGSTHLEAGGFCGFFRRSSFVLLIVFVIVGIGTRLTR